ncbi:MAG: tetratricopeptide repeat protein [Marinilabiliales bacterium]|nr:MAG: tetratricopeptide repeat protein [Marinilabiliales bacterium]
MKTSWKLFLVLFLSIGVALSAVAQDDDDEDGDDPSESKFGTDSAACVTNLSLYGEFVKQKNYKDAVSGWRNAFDICPQSTRKLYSDGVKIYSYLIKNEKDEAKKEPLIDTLLMIYDRRIEYFGNNKKYPEGWILGRKGNEIYRYRRDNVEEAYQCLSKSMEMQKEKTEAGIITPLMYMSIKMMKLEKHSADQVVNDYVTAMDIIEGNIKKLNENELISEAKKAKKLDRLVKTKENLDNLFVASSAATCESIVPIFKPKFEANRDDIDLLKKIVRLLDKQKCEDDPLFFEASAKLNELEPSSMASYALAKMSVKNEKYSKAAEYYNKAIELEQVDSLKAQYYYELAAVTGSKLGNRSKARTYALKAANLKPNWGMPYVLVATFYAASASSCGEDAFHKKIAYWAAVDKLNYAKSVDPSVASEANKLIGAYSGQYPNKEDAFFYGVTEGQTVTVECWINEKTTARF